MKHLFICLTFITVFFDSMSCQEKIVIKPGTNLLDYFTRKETYLNPEFETGTVLFKDGKVSSAKMNYNIVLGQMLFVQPPKDTLAIAYPNEIKILLLKNDTFYYSSGYHKLLAKGSEKFLTQKQYLKIEDIRKGDAYGMTSSLSATTTMSSYTGDAHQTTNLVVNQEFTVSKRCEYYIGNSKGKYMLVNKLSLNKKYPHHKVEIQNFINTEKIDFVNESDVIKLFYFLMKYD